MAVADIVEVEMTEEERRPIPYNARVTLVPTEPSEETVRIGSFVTKFKPVDWSMEIVYSDSEDLDSDVDDSESLAYSEPRMVFGSSLPLPMDSDAQIFAVIADLSADMGLNASPTLKRVDDLADKATPMPIRLPTLPTLTLRRSPASAVMAA